MSPQRLDTVVCGSILVIARKRSPEEGGMEGGRGGIVLPVKGDMVFWGPTSLTRARHSYQDNKDVE